MNSQSAVAESGPGFADRVRSAVFWRWGSQALSQLITWTTTIIVVRLLDPHDYGLFAMTQAVLAALTVFNGYSFATSLIHAREIDDRRIGQVFGMLICSSLLLAGLQFAGAPLAADYYNQPVLTDILRVQALIYLTTPLIALPSSLLARGLQFRNQALVNLCCAVAGATTALALAWTGYGVWALVWAPIVVFSTRAIGLTIATGRIIRPIFDFRGSRDILGFGSALMLCQVFWIVQSEADIVIAGRLFAPHDLGIYSEALFLTLIFTGRFLPPLNEVAFPAYAELNNKGLPVAPAFLSGVRMIMLIATPFYVGLGLVAGPLVETFFGAKWLEMIPVVAGLAFAMPAMALQIICSPATNALGRPAIYVMTSAAGAIIMPVCFLVGVGLGPQGLVASWQAAAPLLLVVTLLLTLPVVGARFGDFAATLLPVVVGCAVMALAVEISKRTLDGVPAPLLLALLTVTGTATYAAALWLLWPRIVRETWATLRRPTKTPS